MVQLRERSLLPPCPPIYCIDSVNIPSNFLIHRITKHIYLKDGFEDGNSDRSLVRRAPFHLPRGGMQGFQRGWAIHRFALYMYFDHEYFKVMEYYYTSVISFFYFISSSNTFIVFFSFHPLYHIYNCVGVY